MLVTNAPFVFPAIALALLTQAAPGEQLPPGHPPVESAKPAPPLPPGHPPTPSVDELMKQLESAPDLKAKEKTFEVAAALGKLYYAHARYAEAVEFLSQADAKATATRALYLEQRKKAGRTPIPPPETVGCASGPQATLDALAAVARTKAQAGEAAAAASCARAALHSWLESQELLAKAKFLVRDAPAALDAYERLLEVFDAHPEALYGRGALLLDTRGDDREALTRARGDLERYLRDYPTGPRARSAKTFLARADAALAAGGIAKLSAQEAKAQAAAAQKLPAETGAMPPRLTQEMIDAVQNTERTPELEAGLIKLIDEAEEHLARGRAQEALDNYKRVVPFLPENGRAKAGMAWSLIGLNRQPMADRVWTVAVSADAAAVDALGDTLKAKGDAQGAKALWKKLLETAPRYAGAEKVKAKLN